MKPSSVLPPSTAGAAAGPAALRIPDISDFEIEQLGDLAGAAVHAAGADYELTMVDVASDSLLGVPDAMVRALADLLSYETEGEGDVLEDVAAELGGRGGHALRRRTGQDLRPAAGRTRVHGGPRVQSGTLRVDILTASGGRPQGPGRPRRG